jgi:hypothetical protein
MNAGSPERDTAWELWKFLGGREYSVPQVESGKTPLPQVDYQARRLAQAPAARGRSRHLMPRPQEWAAPPTAGHGRSRALVGGAKW